jgi:hypothetical protein
MTDDAPDPTRTLGDLLDDVRRETDRFEAFAAGYAAGWTDSHYSHFDVFDGDSDAFRERLESHWEDQR